MISPTLDTLSIELRRAAARRAYAEVERLAVQVGAAAAEQTRALPAGDPGIREIAAWVNELFERTAILLRIARASQSNELRRITLLKRYMQAARVHMAL